MKHRISPGTGRSAGRWRRITALAATAALLFTVVPPASAAENGDGVTPTCDEAYYATTDYYGNLSNGSVVKSYAMNGKSRITDYGTYKKVTNLTDDTKAEQSGDKTTFNFGSNAPKHFYFEGKTSQPFEDLPWRLSITYKLNGVPVKAGTLAGKSGTVEINLNMVPNKNASEYARNNYTLEAMTAFNQNDILSLKADGAQVQLVGNLRVVLFVALPGEEQHVSIQVGTDDFQFDGMTYLMVPATLSQLKQISELKNKKNQMETDYKKLNSSFDTLLNSVNNMSSSLNSAADGMDAMSSAIGSMSAGTDAMYSQTDLLKADLGKIAGTLEPVADQMEENAKALAETQESSQKLVDAAVSLKSELKDIRTDLTKLQNDGKGLQTLATDTAALKSNLTELRGALSRLTGIPSVKNNNPNGMTSSQSLQQIVGLGTAFVTADNAGIGNKNGTLEKNEFVAAMLGLSGKTAAEISAFFAGVQSGDAASVAAYTALSNLFASAGNSSIPFKTFCRLVMRYENIPVTPEQLNLMDEIWSLYNSSTDNRADNQATLGMLMENLDALNSNLSSNISKINSDLTSIITPASTLIYKLESLCDELSVLNTALGDAGSTADVIKTAADKGDTILDAVDSLSQTVNSYLPAAQKSLKTIGTLSTGSAKGIRDTAGLISAMEGYAKQNGAKLTGGAKKSLSALSATLRSAASSLGVTGSVKAAKDDINGIVTDTWEKYTGKVNNLLNMNASASAESLTSDENAAPESVQVLIRTHEIKTSDQASRSEKEKTAGRGTFWSRLVGVFTGIWKDITGKSHS